MAQADTATMLGRGYRHLPQYKVKDFRIHHARRGFDSSFRYQVTTYDTAAVIADTLDFPVNSKVFFYFDVIAHCNDTLAGGKARGWVTIEHDSLGVYHVRGGLGAVEGLSPVGSSLMSEARWYVVIDNNVPLVWVRGVRKRLVNWIVTVKEQLLQ